MNRTERAVIVWKPQPRQLEFMRRPEPEALYGGAAGGGKSDALLIEALRQVHIPHYRALILRKTYPQLSDLVDKSQMYYRRAFPQAQYNATTHVWNFPSGAKIYFGSMQYTKDRTNYQGKAFDFIGFDELTHFEWDEYSYMMSRNRPTGPGTRVYMRATTNPGGIGHGWVKARFITPAPPGTPIVETVTVRLPDGTDQQMERARVFIPSSVFDNPALLANDPGYLASLASLPEAEKQALLYGSWDSFSGQVFTEWRNDPAHYQDQRWTHVIAPFAIPKHWPIWRGYDFGFSKPFSVGWYAADEEGRLYRIKELYGCTGRNLDILARQPIWDMDIDYQCGTGHGVGYILNVHEGPQNMRWRFTEGMVEAVFEDGMDITNEPGIYIQGSHGIRIENVMLAKNDVKNEYGQFMHFETLTWVPIDREVIDEKYLNDTQIKYLHEYQKTVYEKISPYLNEEEKEWLAAETGVK